MPLPTPKEPKVYTCIYNNFKGVDFTSDPTQVYKRRSPDALNIIPDNGGVPHKRPGWEVVYKPLEEEPIRDMWAFSYGGAEHILYVRGNGVYNALGGNTSLMEIADSEVVGVYYNTLLGGAFYLLADSKLREYTVTDGVFKFREVESYVPTTIISRNPSGGGTTFEAVNLLTRRRKESFLGDNRSLDYYVSLPILADSETVKIKNGAGEYDTLVRGTDYTVLPDVGKITMTSVKPPVTVGEDNVIIEYTASGTYEASEQFKKCTVATVYNRKIFLSGADGNFKSYVWYSAYEKANYFPDTSYMVVGDDFTGVMGFIDLGEYLGIVKQSDPESSTIFLAYSMTFEEESTYAIKSSITGVGAISKQTFNSLNGEQLFLSDDGIYGVTASTDSDDSQWSADVKNRSFYINGRLQTEPNLNKAVSVVYKGFYLLCVNNHCYILDSKQKSSWATERSNLQYEGYYWENIPATAFAVHGDELWFGTANGRICKFKDPLHEGNNAYNDNGESISCKWTTILDNDGMTEFFKNLQKKGCLVTIEGSKQTSAEVYIKVDDKEPIYVGTIAGYQSGIPVDLYTKKKIKKYKRIQFVVKNDMPNEFFGVQEIVKLYTIGNYSKNRSANSEEVYVLSVTGDSDLYINGHDADSLNLTYDPVSGDLYYEE